jgi:hypothetical protein
MTCHVPQCRGQSTDTWCSDHGEICTECGIPTFKATVCSRCKAKAAGVKCSVCGSPWVYTTRHPDDDWICRACCMAHVQEMGWDKSPEEVVAELRATEERLEEERKRAEERNAEIAERFLKPAKRKTKQSESLFEEKE